MFVTASFFALAALTVQSTETANYADCCCGMGAGVGAAHFDARSMVDATMDALGVEDRRVFVEAIENESVAACLENAYRSFGAVVERVMVASMDPETSTLGKMALVSDLVSVLLHGMDDMRKEFAKLDKSVQDEMVGILLFGSKLSIELDSREIAERLVAGIPPIALPENVRHMQSALDTLQYMVDNMEEMIKLGGIREITSGEFNAENAARLGAEIDRLVAQKFGDRMNPRVSVNVNVLSQEVTAMMVCNEKLFSSYLWLMASVNPRLGWEGMYAVAAEAVCFAHSLLSNVLILATKSQEEPTSVTMRMLRMLGF